MSNIRCCSACLVLGLAATGLLPPVVKRSETLLTLIS